MMNRQQGIQHLWDCIEGVAGEVACSRAEEKRIVNHGKEALVALGVTEKELSKLT